MLQSLVSPKQPERSTLQIPNDATKHFEHLGLVGGLGQPLLRAPPRAAGQVGTEARQLH